MCGHWPPSPARGQSLAQLALAWALRDPSDGVDCHQCEQRRAANDNLGALGDLSLTSDRLDDIDAYAVDEHINLKARILRRVTSGTYPTRSWS